MLTPSALLISPHWLWGQTTRSRTSLHFTEWLHWVTVCGTWEITTNTSLSEYIPSDYPILQKQVHLWTSEVTVADFEHRPWEAQNCFLSTRPWERVGLDFQKSRCCLWELWEKELMSGTDSRLGVSLLQGKVGQDGECREEVQLKLLPILFTAWPFCLSLVWSLVLQGKIPDTLLTYVRVCWPDTVSWENRLETKGPDMSEQNGNDFTVNGVVLRRLIICSYFTECIKTIS